MATDDTDEPRRGPATAVAAGLLLVAASVGGVAWWNARPAAAPTAVVPADPDVICTGRVDAAGPVIPLEPLQPGRVVAVAVKEGDAVKAGQTVLRIEDDTARFRLTQANAAVDAATVELDAAKAEAEQFAGRIAAQEHLAAAAAARIEFARKMLAQRRDQQDLVPL
ncbi:MAG: biotin/lipoyl-binding protein, partial [Fimbriiglobus sp.]